jgi:hypothetical protein
MLTGRRAYTGRLRRPVTYRAARVLILTRGHQSHASARTKKRVPQRWRDLPLSMLPYAP